eukprot:scaffold87159_cov57-Phaeocystis_antarctica.AAC.1
MPDDLRRAATQGQMRLLQRHREEWRQQMQDKELREKPEVRAEVQEKVQEGPQEKEAAVPEDLLQRILRAPMELVVLVRDRDRVYGN